MRAMKVISAFWISTTATTAVADAPRVAVDIAPVHSLVEQVMEGAGAPDLIIPPGASPHGYAMRPSEARALAASDIVVWVGPALTPWLEGPMENLAPEARRLTLTDAEGVIRLAPREGANFAAHDHDHGHDNHPDDDGDHGHGADHDHKDDHEHGEDHGHDAEHGHDDNHGHAEDHEDHAALDPHLWLDPENAKVWLGVIAQNLSEIDPDNADLYAANAADAKASLDRLSDKVAASMAPLQGQPFVVFHDAYHYFEARFGVEAVAAISMSDDGPASAAHLREVEATISETGALCALAEPRANEALIDAISGTPSFRIERLDANGVDLELGPSFYPALLAQIADGISNCLNPS